MHLMALGAFRHVLGRVPPGTVDSDVLMHLMALGAFRPVLRLNHDADALVLMHLMALGAFRHDTQYRTVARVVGLNAPYGARCFLTDMTDEYKDFLNGS